MNTYTKSLALATTILLAGAVATPAKAAEPTEPKPVTVEVPTTTLSIAAPVTASVNFEAPKVTSVAAPVVQPEPRVTAQQARVAPVRSTTEAQKAPQATPAAPVAQTSPVAPPASGTGSALLSAAYAQVGITQDCTAMVEKALGSLGIVTGDLAPAQFFRFGTVVATPQPGDILISAGHVGIYAGNGQMVSGGFNGNQTRVHPVSYVGAFTAVRVA